MPFIWAVPCGAVADGRSSKGVWVILYWACALLYLPIPPALGYIYLECVGIITIFVP